MDLVELLLLIAAVVAMLARKARVPYTVGLVVTGLIVSFAGTAFDIALTKRMIFTAFLPPLVFEAAYQIPWREFRRDGPVLALFSVVGVLIAASVTSIGMHAFAGWNWTASVLFGVLISATDPVSVIATLKELKAPGRLKLLLESESLLNDGTVAVLFAVVLAVVSGEAASGTDIALSFASNIAGGIGCGAVVAGAILFLAHKTDETFIEITFTTVAAFGSFVLAERLHCSGILSAMTAGIIVGNLEKWEPISERGRSAVASFWQYVAFVVNSLVFLLMGIRISKLSFTGSWAASGFAVLLVLAGRAVCVYLCSLPFHWSRWRIAFAHQHLLVWGGLRGALALALALSLPETMPERAQITTVAFAVVAFSVIVQGLTIAPAMKKLQA